MSTTELKTGITKMIKKLNDERFLRTMYAMVSEYTGNSEEVDFSDVEKKMLDERKKSHKAGKSKSFSVKQMKALVLKGLK